jgi:hypothetical protein
MHAGKMLLLHACFVKSCCTPTPSWQRGFTQGKSEVPNTACLPVRASAAHLDVLDAQPLHNAGREHPAGKRAPEDGIKLPVQASNAEGLEVERLGLEELGGGKALLPQDLDVVVVC